MGKKYYSTTNRCLKLQLLLENDCLALDTPELARQFIASDVKEQFLKKMSPYQKSRRYIRKKK